jgi:hypothetical protein
MDAPDWLLEPFPPESIPFVCDPSSLELPPVVDGAETALEEVPLLAAPLP